MFQPNDFMIGRWTLCGHCPPQGDGLRSLGKWNGRDSSAAIWWLITVNELMDELTRQCDPLWKTNGLWNLARNCLKGQRTNKYSATNMHMASPIHDSSFFKHSGGSTIYEGQSRKEGRRPRRQRAPHRFDWKHWHEKICQPGSENTLYRKESRAGDITKVRHLSPTCV